MATATREPVHLTTEELAIRWRTTRDAIYMLRARGKAPEPIKPGKKLLWPLAAVEAFERSGRARPA